MTLQVDEWHPGLVVEEAAAKDAADVVFFVVGPETRAVASMIEVAELITSNKTVVLVLQDVPKDAVMNGHVSRQPCRCVSFANNVLLSCSSIVFVHSLNCLPTLTLLTST
jgi:hypothetical protein